MKQPELPLPAYKQPDQQGSGAALNFQSGHLSRLDAYQGPYLNFLAVLVGLLSGSLVLFIFLV